MDLRWLVGTLIALSAVLGGLVTFLARLLVKLGRDVERFSSFEAKMNTVLSVAEKIPVFENRVQSAENMASEAVKVSRQNERDIAYMKGETTGRFRALSSPDLEGR